MSLDPGEGLPPGPMSTHRDRPQVVFDGRSIAQMRAVIEFESEAFRRPVAVGEVRV